jgi:hypothetical protein
MHGELSWVKTDAGNPTLHQARVLPCLLGQFEPHRPTGLPLAHVGAVHCVAVRRHIIDAQCDEIASAQFAIDRQI